MQKSKKIVELEKKLAKEKAKAAKVSGFDLVVFDEKTEELKEIKVKTHDLSTLERTEIISAAALLGENFEEIEKLKEEMSEGKTGAWLAFLELTDYSLKKIISIIFEVDEKIVATIPNLELLGMVLKENNWIGEKSQNLAKELEFLTKIAQ